MLRQVAALANSAHRTSFATAARDSGMGDNIRQGHEHTHTHVATAAHGALNQWKDASYTVDIDKLQIHIHKYVHVYYSMLPSAAK